MVERDSFFNRGRGSIIGTGYFLKGGGVCPLCSPLLHFMQKPNQMTSFYMKCSNGVKSVKMAESIWFKNVQYLSRSWPFSGQCFHFISPENTRKLWFSVIFRGYKMGILTRNGITRIFMIFIEQLLLIWRSKFLFASKLST